MYRRESADRFKINSSRQDCELSEREQLPNWTWLAAHVWAQSIRFNIKETHRTPLSALAHNRSTTSDLYAEAWSWGCRQEARLLAPLTTYLGVPTAPNTASRQYTPVPDPVKGSFMNTVTQAVCLSLILHVCPSIVWVEIWNKDKGPCVHSHTQEHYH